MRPAISEVQFAVRLPSWPTKVPGRCCSESCFARLWIFHIRKNPDPTGTPVSEKLIFLNHFCAMRRSSARNFFSSGGTITFTRGRIRLQQKLCGNPSHSARSGLHLFIYKQRVPTRLPSENNVVRNANPFISPRTFTRPRVFHVFCSVERDADNRPAKLGILALKNCRKRFCRRFRHSLCQVKFCAALCQSKTFFASEHQSSSLGTPTLPPSRDLGGMNQPIGVIISEALYRVTI